MPTLCSYADRLPYNRTIERLRATAAASGFDQQLLWTRRELVSTQQHAEADALLLASVSLAEAARAAFLRGRSGEAAEGPGSRPAPQRKAPALRACRTSAASAASASRRAAGSQGAQVSWRMRRHGVFASLRWRTTRERRQKNFRQHRHVGPNA